MRLDRYVRLSTSDDHTDDLILLQVSTVPIYLSEIAAPQHRGLIGGISGCGISFGTMFGWIRMWLRTLWHHAVSILPERAPLTFVENHADAATRWRLPLGIQVPWGVILFVGLCTFMPHSPVSAGDPSPDLSSVSLTADIASAYPTW